MKVPMKWLREFVDPELSPRELAHRMTMAGLEAEKINAIGDLWENVYVGEVLNIEQHPNADRLVLADVVAGDHRLRVVTGAPNIAQGQKVALALAGARLYDGHSNSSELKTLKPGTIRGIRSEGMACSEKELGISDEHEGILVLSPDAPLGAPLRDYLGDTVIEFEITPNLVHAFSILGIAREAAAITGSPMKRPSPFDLSACPRAGDELVAVQDGDLCARYTAVVIEGIAVGPSPDWLVRRLRAAGMRPVNNVVDITNYVMHEVGQPLHAFDLDRLAGGRIVVRRARPGERLETLDHVDRILGIDTLVIADAEKPVGIAGVIGGVDSEVSESTTCIVLESANFEMSSIRRTARSLKLRTEASARFERGLDPNLALEGAARAAELILQLSPRASIAATADVYPEPARERTLALPLAKIERILGVAFPDAEIADALDRLELRPMIREETLTVTIPTYRRDLTIAEDIIEEVARILGYERLPGTLPVGQTTPVKRDPLHLVRRSVRNLLVAAGASEAVTYVTLTQRDLELFAERDSDEAGFLHLAPSNELLRLRNPIQAGRDILRPTLVPSLVAAVAENLRHQSGVRLFELAHVYLPVARNELPREAEVAAIAIAGARAQLGVGSGDEQLDFLDLKGLVDLVLQRSGVAVEWRAEQNPGLHPGRSAAAYARNRLICRLGELHPSTAGAFDIEEQRVAVAEIGLNLLLEVGSGVEREVSVPRFLPVEQDFAVVVDEQAPAATVEAALRQGAGPLATAITLFDIYRGEQIGPGKKSLAFRVTFTAPDRALTDGDLVKVRGRIERTLKQSVGGTLRA